MAECSIRFGITDGESHRASTWKLWTYRGKGKSDLYLTCRVLGSKLKASLHDSGSWHYAYTQKTFEEKVEGVVAKQKDRFIEKWSRDGIRDSVASRGLGDVYKRQEQDGSRVIYDCVVQRQLT